MEKLDWVLTVLERSGKNVHKVLKKYGSHIITGVGGMGIGVAISQSGKKKAEEKAFKEGCVFVSELYEKKFKLSTEKFLAKEKSYEQNKREYEELIKEYEDEIIQLQKKNKRTEDELCEMRFLIDKRNELFKLKSVV